MYVDQVRRRLYTKGTSGRLLGGDSDSARGTDAEWSETLVKYGRHTWGGQRCKIRRVSRNIILLHTPETPRTATLSWRSRDEGPGGTVCGRRLQSTWVVRPSLRVVQQKVRSNGRVVFRTHGPDTGNRGDPMGTQIKNLSRHTSERLGP